MSHHGSVDETPQYEGGRPRPSFGLSRAGPDAGEVSTLKERIETLSRENSTLKEENTTLNALKAQREKEMEDMLVLIREKQSKVDEVNNKVKLLQEQLDQCEAELRKGTGRLPSYKSLENLDEAGEHMTPLKAAQNEIQRCKEVIAEQKETLQSLREQIEALETAKNRLKASERALSMRLLSVKEERDRLMQDLETAQESLGFAAKKAQQYRTKLIEVMNYVKDQEASLTRMQTIKAAKTAELGDESQRDAEGQPEEKPTEQPSHKREEATEPPVEPAQPPPAPPAREPSALLRSLSCSLRRPRKMPFDESAYVQAPTLRLKWQLPKDLKQQEAETRNEEAPVQRESERNLYRPAALLPSPSYPMQKQQQQQQQQPYLKQSVSLSALHAATRLPLNYYAAPPPAMTPVPYIPATPTYVFRRPRQPRKHTKPAAAETSVEGIQCLGLCQPTKCSR
ncbi:unnamed protein product [Vitrella brassicaformis CCMP3155]|uniref:Uncharacterized protein n=1 Tax=Vitrella brassicaformis (strain CCMP3155) TaxID=1169540 RepID=A0A0G4GUG2_VITBC|nr:unnamed protein product [Vitrella brassicaformis CCMP3155]|eukprot:CEM34412.1 unnamed protein product [Vitrella brassicaformis CCMP3155]